MKKLAKQLIEHVREDWDPVLYGLTALWIAILVIANYGFDAFVAVDQDARAVWRILPFVGFYGIPYAVVLGLLFARGRVDTTTPGLWRALAVGLFVVSLADWFPYHRDVAAYFPGPLRVWVSAVAWNLKSTLCWFTPILAYWLAFDRRHDRTCYGITLKGFDAGPYLLCIGILVPLALWASFQPSFLQQYPTYRPGQAEVYLGVSAWWTVIPYELVYGFDFSFVELYFRGFLVIGLARWLGRSAVLPMVAMYAALHFGKPFAETIGSIIGGYILGVFAYNSRSIAGGIILHLSLAWTMEAAAFVQHSLQGTVVR
ncbi:MAG: CPBP family intramembrane metalloprotease [Alphaproteobacteria bacterium]|nr:CPBP family intramembrane metalloprotease [Alphaproteobacteria bacterium]